MTFEEPGLPDEIAPVGVLVAPVITLPFVSSTTKIWLARVVPPFAEIASGIWLIATGPAASAETVIRAILTLPPVNVEPGFEIVIVGFEATNENELEAGATTLTPAGVTVLEPTRALT